MSSNHTQFRYFLLLTSSLFLLSTAQAQFSSYWKWHHHKGTDIVGLNANGDSRSFVMVKNNSGIGCANGATVFSGTKSGDRYLGTLMGNYSKGAVANDTTVTFHVGGGNYQSFTFLSKTRPGGTTPKPVTPTKPTTNYSSYWSSMGKTLGLIANGNNRTLIIVSTGKTFFSGTTDGKNYKGTFYGLNGGNGFWVTAPISNNSTAINFNGTWATFSHK